MLMLIAGQRLIKHVPIGRKELNNERNFVIIVLVSACVSAAFRTFIRLYPFLNVRE
jgi:hypothetical protein